MTGLLAQAQQAAGPVTDRLTVSEVIAPYMGTFFTAFLIAILATPLMRTLALRNGIVDRPDLLRKNHIQPVAYLGGVAIFLGWLGGVMLCYFTQPHDPGGNLAHLQRVYFPISIVLGAGVITITGLLDDVYGISPRVKVGGQLFAAACLASREVGIKLVDNSLGLLNITPPEWVVYVLGTAAIAVFVIGGCNALNLLDGLDGLAGGVTGIAAAGFLVIAAFTAVWAQDSESIAAGVLGDPIRLTMCLAILGAVLGFLPYNYNPATIFMGDAGSLLLGYLSVSAILLFAEVPGRGLLLVTACLIVFALPITDTSLAIFRRKIRGQPLFSPDNQHIHHLLRRAGLTVRQSVGVLWGVAVLFAVLGCGMVAMELRWRYILAVFVVLYGTIMVIAYKYGQQQYLLEQRRQVELAARGLGADPAGREAPGGGGVLPEAPVSAPPPAAGDRAAAAGAGDAEWSAHKPA